MIRLMIISDIRLYREGLAQILGRSGELTVIGTATDRRDAAPRIAKLQPDVILLDMAIPDSHATAREINRVAPAVRLVALGIREVEGDIVACAEAGIAGYVRRDGSLEDLVIAVEGATRGELHCSPRMAADLLRRLAQLAGDRGGTLPCDLLTQRERQCVQLIDQGLSNKEIARTLGIEIPTVKNHVHNLLEKLHVHRRIEAARLTRALSSGRGAAAESGPG